MAMVSFKRKKKGDNFFTEHVRAPVVKKKKDSDRTVKEVLEDLSIDQLKLLGVKYNVVLKATQEIGLYEPYMKDPTRESYIEKLSKIMTFEDMKSSSEIVAKVKKKRRQSQNPW